MIVLIITLLIYGIIYLLAVGILWILKLIVVSAMAGFVVIMAIAFIITMIVKALRVALESSRERKQSMNQQRQIDNGDLSIPLERTPVDIISQK